MSTGTLRPSTAVDTATGLLATSPRRRRPGRSLALALPPLAVFAAILVAWYLASSALGSRGFLLPAPHRIFTEGFFDPQASGDILTALGNTTLVALTGLSIAIVLGVAWAVAMSQAKWIERSLFPYAVILQCIPILALVPLIGFWFGFDFPARTIVCVLISLFPMVSNTLFGLQSVDRSQRELFALQRAGRWTLLTKLLLPASLPAIFAGMRISAGLAVVGAIVGDFFFRRGTPGLGALMNVYTSRLQSPQLFAAVLTAALLGIAIFLLFGWLTRAVVGRWYETSS
ncbi:ABC transporter permease [Rathayibacter sp. Leaf296]|uniref:ABC transporter permease n=1 Tax=Rathayibacter sp. Leaf296 TaxID=1736327 RepID=UPI000703BB54|nr:ABC transporter permease [Rathayibacter sp. Leaf296]KQQ09576.1 nitrate ABC transporter permease [Rathayibacter sp. Leaf296]